MVDFAYVCGMSDDSDIEPDRDVYDPVGHCGGDAPWSGRDYRYRTSGHLACKFCGATDLKWRNEGGAWRLVENKRVQPGNYKPLHTCEKLNTPDGFDDVP